MSVEKMRAALAEVYNGNIWRIRVNGMDDRQVVAVYKSMKAEGRLKKHPTIKKKEPGIRKAVQLSIFDEGFGLTDPQHGQGLI